MQNKEEVFKYLDDVRKSGEINMFGAASMIQEKFKVPKSQASRVLVEWMNTYGERHPD